MTFRSSNRTTAFTKDFGGFCATDEGDEPLPIIYFFGIIDILQPYNFSKQVEHNWKSGVLRLNKNDISSVSPTVYAERFLKFIKNHVSTQAAEDVKKEYKRECREQRRRIRQKRRDNRSNRLRERQELSSRRNKTDRNTSLLDSITNDTEISEHESVRSLRRVSSPLTAAQGSSEVSQIKPSILALTNSDASEGECTSPLPGKRVSMQKTEIKEEPKRVSMQNLEMKEEPKRVSMQKMEKEEPKRVVGFSQAPSNGTVSRSEASLPVSSSQNLPIHASAPSVFDHCQDEMDQVPEETLDDPLLDVKKAPKRKRTKEKSLLNLHALR